MVKSKFKKEIVVLDESGKVPPSDWVTEHAIIGAILLQSKDKFCQQVMQMLKPEHFYKHEHVVVYTAIHTLFRDDRPIDILTVVNELRHTAELESIGGPAYIATLTNNIAGTSNIVYWFHSIIYPLYLRRKMIERGALIINDAHDLTTDIFDKLDEHIDELSSCKPDVAFKPSHSAKSVGEEVRDEMGIEENEGDEEKIILKKYITGHKQFDDVVGIYEGKIVVIGGYKGTLKTRFTNHLITIVAEKYEDIACFWVSLEDNAKEQCRIYISSKVHIRPEALKFRLFDKIFRPDIGKWLKVWESFKFKIRDQSIKIKDIGESFKQFCSEHPDCLKVLIIDNVLSLGDFDQDFKYDINRGYDYVGKEILNIKQKTNALVIVVHHFNEDASNKSELPNGYRPRLVNLKGTEVWKRIAYQTILLNYPRAFHDLINQYSGDTKEVLSNMWLADIATNRGHAERDEETLLRFFVNPDFCKFKEIDKNFEMPEVPEPEPKSNEPPF